MDKKTKKKIDTLHQRLAKLRNQLSGAKRQQDDDEQVRSIEHEIAQAEEQLSKLKP